MHNQRLENKPDLHTPDTALTNRVLTPSRIIFLDKHSKTEALQTLTELLSKDHHIRNPQELTSAIFRREELMSTGIGLGIGVPHVRLDSVDDIVMAVGVCRTPLTDYESLDNEPVRIVCMIAANTNQHTKHIKLLSAVSKLLKDKSRRDSVLAARTAQEVYNLFLENPHA